MGAAAEEVSAIPYSPWRLAGSLVASSSSLFSSMRTQMTLLLSLVVADDDNFLLMLIAGADRKIRRRWQWQGLVKVKENAGKVE